MEITSRKELKDIWNGLPYNYKTCVKILKRDAVFCDYFNAFLSLPAFARPLYYDRKTESLLEVYRDCKVPVVGITIQAAIPTGEIQEYLQQWLLKYRLPLFLKTSLFIEYLLCKQILRVCGAIPDKEDSEEELTESESEGESESEVVEKERHVLDIAGLDRNSQMSVVEGLSTPLLHVPRTPDPSTLNSVTSPLMEETMRPETDHTDVERDLIALSSTTLFEGAGGTSSEFDEARPSHWDSLPAKIKAESTVDVETTTTSAPSGRKSINLSTIKLPEISSAPVTTQQQILSPEEAKIQEGEEGAVKESEQPGPVVQQAATLYSHSPSPGIAELEQKILPDIFSASITDMLPDSQSDIASPHVWQKLYKDRRPKPDKPGASCVSTPVPSPVTSTTDCFNEEFPDLPLTKHDRKSLIGSVSGMDSLREFLSRTAGEHLLNLWLDITQIERQLGSEEDGEKRIGMIRDLQDKYKTRLTKSAKDRLFRRDFSSLQRLREQALRKLQFYWVPRYFQMKMQTKKENPPLKLELDEELLKLPFLPSAAVSRSYPSQLTNLTTVINSTDKWDDLYKEQDSRIISGRLRSLSASIAGSKKDHFMYAIRSDKHAGGPFRDWLQGNGNKDFLDILSFCEEVTQYRIYEDRKADRGILKRLGWSIWHMYMAPGAPCSLGLGPSITSDVRIALLSTKDYVPYTTFEVAKGNLLLFLKRAWKEYIQMDYEEYLQARPDIMDQIRTLTENRIRQMQGHRINQNRKRYRAHRHRRGKKKRLHTVFDSASEGELEEEDFENMSIPNLHDVLNNRQAMEKFNGWSSRTLSGDKMQLYNLWNDLRSYFEINKQSNKHLRTLQAEHIHRTHFFNKDLKKAYQFPTEIHTKISREQTARPQSPLLTKTMTFCENTIKLYFDEFVQSLPLAQAALRRRNTSDDMNSVSQQSFVMGGRRRGRGGKNKKMPGRATPTKELYHRLLNLLLSVTGTWPEELLLFEKYLGEHGADDGYPLIVNDLHFWVEVQRFKDMHHGDTDSDLIYRKLEAIVDCYLDPQIPTEPPPEKPPNNMSPPNSPTPSMASKGQSSAPESPVQSKIDIASLTEKQKKLPWAQRKQVDLTVDIGQKISNRMATPGGHLEKDMSFYDESQKMVLKELVPFYAGFANRQDSKSSTVLSECKVCEPVVKPGQCHTVNRKWIGSPASDTVMLFPLPSPTSNIRPRHIQTNKEHFTFTLEHGVTWTKHIDEDMISANSDDALPTRIDNKGIFPSSGSRMSGSSGSAAAGDGPDRNGKHKRKRDSENQARIATKIGSITALTTSAKMMGAKMQIINKGSTSSLLKKDISKMSISQKSSVKVT